MGLPPPNYNKDSLLPEPVAKKTILPIQGGGSRIQKGGAPPINEKELLIQCHEKYLQLHYVKGGKLAEPIGKDVRYIDMDDVNFEGIKKKSIMYSWFIGQECFDKYVITVLNDTAEYMKEGGTIVFVDYDTRMMSLDKLKGFIATKEKEIPLTHKWDISIVKVSDFPFLLGYNTGDQDKIPKHLMLFKLLAGSPPATKLSPLPRPPPPPPPAPKLSPPPATKLSPPPAPKLSPVTKEKPAPKESTIKLAVGLRVRNPEEAKDKIRELSFTPGEQVLFRRLGFDKPFIRKYITMPEGSKQVSDASKDAFFKFWKTYVLMDGTSQFSLMTKGESQKVQQYMRDILDAYRKYLSESALQLLFHNSGKAYEPVLEGVQDSSVITKTVNAKPTNYKKISTAVKTLIQAVAATKELDFKGHRLSIAKANTLPIVKAAYDNLKKDMEKLIVEANTAIDAAKEASLDTSGEELAAVEGFKFIEREDPEDYIKAANDLISLVSKLIKKLDNLENAAREFAIVVELEGEGKATTKDEEYVQPENGDEEEEEEEEEKKDPKDTTPKAPQDELLTLKKLITNKSIKDPQLKMLNIFKHLNATFPEIKYGDFKKLMGIGRGPTFSIQYQRKIDIPGFFTIYEDNTDKHTFNWILNTLLRIDYSKITNTELKEAFVTFFKTHTTNFGGFRARNIIMTYIGVKK
jgi:hypothetical protein